MIVVVAVLMSYCCLGLNGAAAAAGNTTLERIQTCGIKCSQGLHCKPKPDSFFPPPCQKPADGLNTSTVFKHINLSTVMRCEGRQKCSLHLRIQTKLQLTEFIHGVSICTNTAGMMSYCRIIGFTKASRERMSGLQVEVENDCTDIYVGQQVKVTVKTVPSYCGITWTSTYEAPRCSSDDLQRHVPECITGRLSYDLNQEKKQLSVQVSNMLEDYDYHLRLCRRDFICMGTGASTLIKKEEPVKSAVLSYSRPLPCLCIEGWSAMMDARRIQLCPFKDRLEELWSGIIFDQLEGTLSWEPACPVDVVVALCQEREDGACVDLPHTSQNVSRKKITYTKVDPHPRLCMKFTTGSQSWTRCPFATAGFQAWEVTVTGRQGQADVEVSSPITATFSVGLCVKTEGSAVCQITKTHTVHVEKTKASGLNLKGGQCDSCLQVKRIDVEFAPTVIHCPELCDQLPSISRSTSFSSDLTWVIVPAGVCLSGIIIITLVLHVLLTVQRRKQRRNAGRTSEKQMDPSCECVVPGCETRPVHDSRVFVPDSPQCGNTERSNLISD